ncbi:hypothetical protein [Oceanicaulis sp. MMSF_3324]|uniref:hypothetical protein n=1 Tax=Oceanicaulis sp. MMSF_3324 TaxID=3046702 RepID=UPI00273D2597|nr:hypothetical protein [Oceanicaulis sp. MMSF_3324]
MKRGFLKLYGLQRLGEWLSASVLGVIAIFLGGDMFGVERSDWASVVLGVAGLWAGLMVFSGWVLASTLGLFAFRLLDRAIEYALAMTGGALIWLLIWMPVLRPLSEYPPALYAYLAVCLGAVFGVAWLAHKRVASRVRVSG